MLANSCSSFIYNLSSPFSDPACPQQSYAGISTAFLSMKEVLALSVEEWATLKSFEHSGMSEEQTPSEAFIQMSSSMFQGPKFSDFGP